jgi:hypothetical protein
MIIFDASISGLSGAKAVQSSNHLPFRYWNRKKMQDYDRLKLELRMPTGETCLTIKFVAATLLGLGVLTELSIN